MCDKRRCGFIALVAVCCSMFEGIVASCTSPLFMKCSEGDLKSVELIEKATKEELDGEDEKGRGAFHYLVLVGSSLRRNSELKLRVMRALLKKGFDIHKKDKGNQTPLHMLTDFGLESSAAALLGEFLREVKPESLEWKDDRTYTPLYNLVRWHGLLRFFILKGVCGVCCFSALCSFDDIFSDQAMCLHKWLKHQRHKGMGEGFKRFEFSLNPYESLMQKYLISFDPAVNAERLHMTMAEEAVRNKHTKCLSEKTPRELHFYFFPYKNKGMVFYMVNNLKRIVPKRGCKTFFKDMRIGFAVD